jgi:hypothetical protein
VQGVERTVAGLRDAGRLEAADEAAVALARTLAGALDTVDPVVWPAQVASLARAQLATLKLLRGVADDDRDAGLDELLAALGNASEPGPS